MSTIARRFAIFTLIVAVFAIGFSAIVAHPSRMDLRVHNGFEVGCAQTGGCTATI